ncbi:MAG: hypothetical protein GXP55_18995 [Deltaproteobacteria bacterium]|nr:hypothetical protein [Deltaproteobacteria bacterium]
MSRPLRHFLFALALCLGTFTLPRVALADALVVITVDSASHTEGVVTLTARTGGRTFSCTTQHGSCSVNGVPGGHYSVVFRPSSGQPTDARSVMIAPAGRVELHLAAP